MGCKQNQKNTVVITGAGGFLGRNLLSLLRTEDVKVAAVTSKSQEELYRLSGKSDWKERLVVVAQDDYEEIKRVLRDASFLINCGFPRVMDGSSLANGMKFISWLFSLAKQQDVNAVINISSQSVYDQHRSKPAVETDPVSPDSPYALAKYATELMLNWTCEGLPSTNIRLASLIGPGFNQRVINKMIISARERAQIDVNEQGSKFGYLDCLDAARGIIALLASNPDNWLTEYNLGAKRPYTLTELATIIKKRRASYGLSTKVVVSQSDGKSINSSLNSEQFTALTGWHPLISMEESADRIIRSEQRLSSSN